MSYVVCFLAPVPTAKKDAYLKHSREAGAVFKEHGALEQVECWEDDVSDGALTSIPMAVKRGADESVVFGWIRWPSRTVRDAGMAAAMADSRLPKEPIPFDGKRLIYGGFETIMTRDAAAAVAEPAYVTGFIAAVPSAEQAAFLAHAEIAATVMIELGALRVVENWGDDVPEGETTSFPMAVKRAEGEVVICSWVLWPSREICDAAMPQMMADPRMTEHPMPFDGARVIYGGFSIMMKC